MNDTPLPPNETVTLGEAKSVITHLARTHSLLLLSPPGVGKSDSVAQAAASAGLPLKSLLGTQIAPEDVSGVPRIVGDRSVFCPPRVLLPESNEPICLFLDELPATSPDIQKAFYSLLLERRVGEYPLPKGTWVVAAGNRMEDRALVRAMSSALVNRVIVLNVRLDVKEWLTWARSAGVRDDILSFILFMPEALMRPVPSAPVPFSTPRAWTMLSSAFTQTEAAGILTPGIRRALAFGSISAVDAALFCTMIEHNLRPADQPAAIDYIRNGLALPEDAALRWLVLDMVRRLIKSNDPELKTLDPQRVQSFLNGIPLESRFALLIGLVDRWGALGANEALLGSIKEAFGIE